MTASTEQDGGWVLGLDVGGSGSRLGLAPLSGGPREEREGPGVRVGAGGSSVPEVIEDLLGLAWNAWPRQCDGLAAVGVGATGVASLVDDPADLRERISRSAGARVALAVDAVTAHLGALGGAAGSVAVLGTGAIAVAHEGPSADGTVGGSWRRVDGWGHLLGDRGGGAWLGRLALEVAMREHDGVAAVVHGRPGSGGSCPDPAVGAELDEESSAGQRRSGEAGDVLSAAALLAAAIRRFGDPAGWPGLLYTRPDRAGVLATVTHDIVTLADAGDPLAQRLLCRAGAEAAASAIAALGPDATAGTVVVTGGLARGSARVRAGFAERVAELRPQLTVADAVGDPLDGALTLARLTAGSRLEPQSGMVWA